MSTPMARHPVEDVLSMLGFAPIGEVVEHEIVYDSTAADLAGGGGAR